MKFKIFISCFAMSLLFSLSLLSASDKPLEESGEQPSPPVIDIHVTELNEAFLQHIQSPIQHLSLIQDRPEHPWLECFENSIPIVPFSNTSLQSLSLQTYKLLLSDDLINQISCLKSLQRLTLVIGMPSLDSITYSDLMEKKKQSMSLLSALTTLRTLSLTNVASTGDDPGFLSMLTNLNELTLKSCGITTLRCVSLLTGLTSLSLPNNMLREDADFETPLEDSFLEPLSGLTKLKNLDITPWKVSGMIPGVHKQ